MVCRECVYYINMRQAYLLAPQHAHRLSARTVLFTCVPKRFLDEHRIRKLYGDSVMNVWIPANTKDLERLVKERESTAERLEIAEIELIKKANIARKKAIGEEALPTTSKGIAPVLRSWPGRKRRIASASRNSTTSSSSATSAASAAPSVSPPPSLSASSSSSSFGETAAAPNSPLSTVPSHGSGDLASAAIKATFREEISPVDRHGSVSEAASSPSAADTVVATMPSPATELTEDEAKGKEWDDKDGKDDKDGNDDKDGKDDKNEDEDDEEDEKNYVHPYGYAPTLPDVRGSVAAQWLPAESRPRHRPLSNYGRRVDTIRWTRNRLKTLNQTIARSRRRLRGGDGEPLSALFVEFDTQAAAQVAFQVLSHHQPLHMSPRFIGIRPNDIIWSSLRMKWWERIMRRFAMMGAVSAGVIFWSIPSALVGVISNVKFLSSKVFFLKWLADLPSFITGVIEGLLPSLALSLLMAMVPAMLRGMSDSFIVHRSSFIVAPFSLPNPFLI